MKIRKNSVLGWTIHIGFAALMGWFMGYLVIPGTIALAFDVMSPEWVRIGLGIVIGAFYLYCYRKDIDTAFPFKNGGWLR